MKSDSFFLMMNEGMLIEWPVPSSDMMRFSESSSRLSFIIASLTPCLSMFLTLDTKLQLLLSAMMIGLRSDSSSAKKLSGKSSLM